MNSKEEFIISMPTHDRRGNNISHDYLWTAMLHLHAQKIKRSMYWNYSIGSGMPFVRSMNLKNLKNRYPDESHVWTLWIDSDIEIVDDPLRLVNGIIYAEKNMVNWGAEVKTLVSNQDRELQGISFKTAKDRYTDQELNDAPDFTLKLHHSGLGFCYVYTPLDYEFHSSGFDGEDVNYFMDNKLELVHYDICNKHYKSVGIWSKLDQEKDSTMG